MRIVLATALLALLSEIKSINILQSSLSVEPENVLLALKRAVQSLQTNVGSESAGIYAQLVRIFRASSKDDLLNVYTQMMTGGDVKDNNLAKKMFMDSLLRAGTADSIEVAIKLLKLRELSDFE